MIDTAKTTQLIIDKATSGQLSVGFKPEDSVEDICKSLPVPSDKRRKLFDEACEYNDQYEIPEHWRWIKLGLISSYGDSPVKTMASNVDPGTWILELEDIQKGGKILQRNTVREKKTVGDKTVFKKGQVLYSKLRPYLKKVLIADTDGISTPELISFDVFGGVMPQYLVYCLKNTYTDKVIEKRSYGIKMPRVDAGFMANLPIPVPPISEQMYIVDKVEKANAALDAIDRNQSKYQNDNLIIKGKLIDAAIQGKLTEQLPEDGTAEELYQQIQQEKRKLEAEGKIKKSKPLSLISDEVKMLDLPGSWDYYKLGDLAQKITDGEHLTPRRTKEFCGYYLLSARNIKNGHIDLSDVDYVEKEEFEKIATRCNPQLGDVLISCSGTIGRCSIIDDDNKYVMVRSAAMVSPVSLNSKYLMYSIQSGFVQKQIEMKQKQTAQANLFQDAIRNLVIPLPPLAEQNRIVAKLEELLPLCE